MSRVLLTDPIDASGEEVLRQRGAEVVNAPEGSAEWELLYQKTREEVYRRRFRL